MKICSRCKKELPITEFKKGNYKDGLYCWCKNCKITYDKRYHLKNKEKHNKQRKVYRNIHKKQIEEYRESHKKEISEQRKEYYLKHQE